MWSTFIGVLDSLGLQARAYLEFVSARRMKTKQTGNWSAEALPMQTENLTIAERPCHFCVMRIELNGVAWKTFGRRLGNGTYEVPVRGWKLLCLWRS